MCTHGLGIEVEPTYKLSKCRAACLSQDNMDHFKDLFYFNKSKIDQDKFILKYLVIKNPSKVTTTAIDRKRKRSITITYLVRNEDRENIEVCASTFRSILNVSENRICRIAREFHGEGTIPTEKMGGRRHCERNEEQTHYIKRHIMKYKCRESHYSRRHSTRSYLPPELIMKILWERYCQERIREGYVKCSLSKYKSVFYKYFNIGFGNFCFRL